MNARLGRTNYFSERGHSESGVALGECLDDGEGQRDGKDAIGWRRAEFDSGH